jgi:hypothetical protein
LFENNHKAEKAQQAAHDRHLQELSVEIDKLSTRLTWLKKKSGLEPFEK